MWNRNGVTSLALERAMAQLSTQRLASKTGVVKRNELEEYMDSLTKKTRAIRARQSSFQNMSNISSEKSQTKHKTSIGTLDNTPLWDESPREIGDNKGSRFLKKAPSHPSVPASLSPELSKTDTGRSVATIQRRSQSMAQSRLALIENRIKKHMQTRDRSGGRTGLQTSEETSASPQSSSNQSMRGSRFLKKKTPPVLHQDPKVTPSSMYFGPQQRSFNTSVSFDSDEEDIKKLLGGSPGPQDILLKEDKDFSPKGLDSQSKSFIRSSEKLQVASPQLFRRVASVKDKSLPLSPDHQELHDCSVVHSQGHPSPPYSVRSSSVLCSPSPLSLGRTASSRGKFLRPSLSSVSVHSDARSLDELFVRDQSSHDSISEGTGASDDFKINIMTLDDLAPDNLETSERYRRDETMSTTEGVKDVSPPLNVVDFNEVGNLDVQTEEEYESDFESEIKTEADDVSSTSEHHRDNDASTAEKAQDAFSESFQQREISSQSEEDSKIQRSAPESLKSSSQCSKSSENGRSRNPLSRSASQSVTITPPLKKGALRPSRAVKEIQTQTDLPSYMWSTGEAAFGPTMGMSYQDPAPISSHVVSAGTVEALTTYNPAVVALNDTLRQQLSLIRQFVETSRYLHALALESLGPENYQYMTLEDTKEFIENHKSPKMTMEQALEEVMREMREHHCL